MCRLSWNLGASISWNPQGLSRPVKGWLYVFALLFVCKLRNSRRSTYRARDPQEFYAIHERRREESWSVKVQDKGKSKVNPVSCHKGKEGEEGYTLPSTFALDVGGWSTQSPGTHCRWGWTDAKTVAPTEIRSPVCPASRVAIPTELSLPRKSFIWIIILLIADKEQNGMARIIIQSCLHVYLKFRLWTSGYKAPCIPNVELHAVRPRPTLRGQSAQQTMFKSKGNHRVVQNVTMKGRNPTASPVNRTPTVLLSYYYKSSSWENEPAST